MVLLKYKSVCLLTTSYPSWGKNKNNFPGKGKFVHDMAKFLAKSGYQVHVITHHEKYTPSFEVKDNVRIHRFHYFVPGWETLTGGLGIPENINKAQNKIQIPFYFIALLVTAIKIINKYNLEFINAHWAFPTGLIGLLLKKLTGKKLVVTAYGAELFPINKGQMSWARPLIKMTVSQADLVAGISQATVSAAKTISGRQDIKVIPDGIDVDYYKPGKKNVSLLKKYRIFGNKIIFFTGRMVERKGHRYLLEAMRFIDMKKLKVKLILGGDGPLFDDLFRLREKWHLKNDVIMPGYLPEKEIVPFLQSIDVFVLPSCIDKNGDTEGSATAALEAMSCGTPAIISYVGGNIGAIKNGKGAFYYENQKSADLGKKLLKLLTNTNLLNINKKLARNYIINHHSWKINIDNYTSNINLIN